MESSTGRAYWVYVPSDYSPDHPRPLVITLHGASPWDSAKDQIREWKHLAEKSGLIVAAPELGSAALQILSRSGWKRDLESDRQAILAILDELEASFSIARVPGDGPSSRPGVLLTAFLEGGYALYDTGLEHPDRFSTLVARDCYVDEERLTSIEINEDARALPIVIFNGKDGWDSLARHGWTAFRFLRENGCFRTRRKEVRGGQLRRPGRAYEYWMRYAGAPPAD